MAELMHSEKIQIIEQYLDDNEMTKTQLIEQIGDISKGYGMNALSPNFNRDTPTWVNTLVYMIQKNDQSVTKKDIVSGLETLLKVFK